MSCTGYEVHVNATKTRTSVRTIDIDARTLEVLLEWRQAQVTELGGAHDATPVFPRPGGTRVHPHAVLDLRTTPVTPRRTSDPFHDLRHTHATLLLRAGVPLKVVSERLGHSTPAFTMAVYQHVLPGMQRDAAETFARLIDGHAVSVDSPNAARPSRWEDLRPASLVAGAGFEPATFGL